MGGGEVIVLRRLCREASSLDVVPLDWVKRGGVEMDITGEEEDKLKLAVPESCMVGTTLRQLPLI